MDDTDFFSTDSITVSIGFRLLAIAEFISIVNNRRNIRLSGTGALSRSPTWPNIFPIVHDRDKFSNREQSETNRNDVNAMCDYLSEYLRMRFRLYEDSSRAFLNILPTLCERSKIAENK